jgi:hypothetical protein
MAFLESIDQSPAQLSTIPFSFDIRRILGNT